MTANRFNDRIRTHKRKIGHSVWSSLVAIFKLKIFVIQENEARADLFKCSCRVLNAHGLLGTYKFDWLCISPLYVVCGTKWHTQNIHNHAYIVNDFHLMPRIYPSLFSYHLTTCYFLSFFLSCFVRRVVFFSVHVCVHNFIDSHIIVLGLVNVSRIKTEYLQFSFSSDWVCFFFAFMRIWWYDVCVRSRLKVEHIKSVCWCWSFKSSQEHRDEIS